MAGLVDINEEISTRWQWNECCVALGRHCERNGRKGGAQKVHQLHSITGTPSEHRASLFSQAELNNIVELKRVRARACVCRPFGVVWPARIRAPWLDYCVLTPVLLLRLRAGKGWRCRAVSCGDDLKGGEFSCGCWFALRPFWFVYGHLLVEIQSNPRAMVTVSRERQIANLFDISLD